MASRLPRGLGGLDQKCPIRAGHLGSSYASASVVVWEALYLTEHHVGTASRDPFKPLRRQVRKEEQSTSRQTTTHVLHSMRRPVSGWCSTKQQR